MKLVFQHGPSPVSVAVLGSHWSKELSAADMTSSYELFSLGTFQPIPISIERRMFLLIFTTTTTTAFAFLSIAINFSN